MGRIKKRSRVNYLVRNPSKKVLAAREAWLIDNLEAIVMTIAEGGSLITICKAAQVPYSIAIKCVYADRHRQLLYEKALEARTEWMVQRVLDEVRRIGVVDIREAFGPDGNLLPVKRMPEDVARAIQGIEFIEERNGHKTKVKFADKLKALELLGKQVDMFTTKVDIGGSISLEKLVEDAAARRTTLPKRGELEVDKN